MDLPIKISFRNMEPSDAVTARVRERVERLTKFSQRVVACQVVIEARHRRRHKGRLYAVHVRLATPREEIIVNRAKPLDHAHEDVYVALRDSFDAVTRQLEDHERRGRGEVKQHAASPEGKVARLLPDYGFIALADGSEVYFHRNSVGAGGFDRLEVGDRVRLAIAENESPEGPQATSVVAIRRRTRRAASAA